MRNNYIIKWSFWRRTAERFIPVESTRLTVYLLGLRPRKASGAARPPLSFQLCCGLRGVLRTLKLTNRTRYVRSTLKLNAAISDSKIGGLRTMLAEDQQWGGPGSMGTNMPVLAINLLFRSRRAYLPKANETVRYVDSTGINRLAVRLQKLHFMKSLFVNI